MYDEKEMQLRHLQQRIELTREVKARTILQTEINNLMNSMVKILTNMDRQNIRPVEPGNILQPGSADYSRAPGGQANDAAKVLKGETDAAGPSDNSMSAIPDSENVRDDTTGELTEEATADNVAYPPSPGG